MILSSCRLGATHLLSIAFCLLLSVSWLLFPTPANADGGAIRLSEQRGPYQITVFTSPTSLRAGPVDVSVLVLDCTNGQPIPDAEVTVRAVRSGKPGEGVFVQATSDAATNKLLQAAIFDLPEAGQWKMEVEVKSRLGETQVQFDLDVAEPLPRWASLWPWIGWPGLVIVFFGLHQWLVRRRSK
jgi:hypothetical protein